MRLEEKLIAIRNLFRGRKEIRQEWTVIMDTLEKDKLKRTVGRMIMVVSSLMHYIKMYLRKRGNYEEMAKTEIKRSKQLRFC
jgi:hypothetical protein